MTDRTKLAEVAMGLKASREGLEPSAEKIESLQKEAAAGAVAKGAKEGAKAFGIMDAAKKVWGTTLGVAPVVGLAALGNEVLKNRQALDTQNKFNHALSYAVNSNTILSGANKSQVKDLAQSVYNIAPNAASDPNVLTSVLANAVHYGEVGSGLDPRTARDLMELEEKHHKIKQLSSSSIVDVARTVT